MSKIIDTTMDKTIEMAIDSFLGAFKRNGGYSEVGEEQIRKIIREHLQVDYEADIKIIVDKAAIAEKLGTFDPTTYQDDVKIAREKFVVKLKELLFMGEPTIAPPTTLH